jgi:hypothetical protein
MAKADFEKLLLKAIDEAMASIGESSKQAIYYHLEKGFTVKREEIPCKPEAFILGIEKLFGMGANFLESLMLKRLYEKTGLRGKEDSFKGLTFAETVVAVKQAMEK